MNAWSRWIDSEGELSRDQLETGLRLGWAVECLQTAFLMADDIMDKSETRRGVPCWYKKVGLTAINDLMTIDSCVYSLLRSLPSSLPVNELVELFSEVTLITEQGQTLDMQNSELPEVDLSKFTRDNYSGECFVFISLIIIALSNCQVQNCRLLILPALCQWHVGGWSRAWLRDNGFCSFFYNLTIILQ